MKGAPESVLAASTHVLCNEDGATVPMSEAVRQELLSRVTEFGQRQTLRCMALALRPMPPATSQVHADHVSRPPASAPQPTTSEQKRAEEGLEEKASGGGWEARSALVDQFMMHLFFVPCLDCLVISRAPICWGEEMPLRSRCIFASTVRTGSQSPGRIIHP